ncbi:ABC-three component system protein [Flavobacterium columnare]|uniref:ABC-three component system protein n=1 Tax=Flavobacterium columnare TaxID=996 RepID=UPI003C2AF69B
MISNNDNQNINNNSPIDKQVNIQNFNGSIGFGKKSRLSQRFEKLKNEVENDIRYNDFIDDFLSYNTKLDGRSMPDKLKDGGFSDLEIIKATSKKHKYSKKLEKNKLYETAQIIDVELFSMISLNFETYIEPLINDNADKTIIKTTLTEKVVMPIINLINDEGVDDTFLNYNVDDILGMIYFLTGKCHINWANYDNI